MELGWSYHPRGRALHVLLFKLQEMLKLGRTPLYKNNKKADIMPEAMSQTL